MIDYSNQILEACLSSNMNIEEAALSNPFRYMNNAIYESIVNFSTINMNILAENYIYLKENREEADAKLPQKVFDKIISMIRWCLNKVIQFFMALKKKVREWYAEKIVKADITSDEKKKKIEPLRNKTIKQDKVIYVNFDEIENAYDEYRRMMVDFINNGERACGRHVVLADWLDRPMEINKRSIKSDILHKAGTRSFETTIGAEYDLIINSSKAFASINKLEKDTFSEIKEIEKSAKSNNKYLDPSKVQAVLHAIMKISAGCSSLVLDRIEFAYSIISSALKHDKSEKDTESDSKDE